MNPETAQTPTFIDLSDAQWTPCLLRHTPVDPLQ
jgi:hypothetical protein